MNSTWRHLPRKYMGLKQVLARCRLTLAMSSPFDCLPEPPQQEQRGDAPACPDTPSPRSVADEAARQQQPPLWWCWQQQHQQHQPQQQSTAYQTCQQQTYPQQPWQLPPTEQPHIVAQSAYYGSGHIWSGQFWDVHQPHLSVWA